MSQEAMRQIRLTINGRPQTLAIQVQETLLEVLRERLGLTGAKLGCDQQVCGTCTVMLNGLPVSSCSVLAVDATDSDVLTIEGLAAGGNLHPIQRAFIEHGAFQCAFCTPGLILAVKALLAQLPNASDEQARHFLAGNICRCGCQMEILSAVRALVRDSRETVQ